MGNRFLIYSLLILVIGISCTRDIDIELPQPEPEVVVDGWIEQGQFPMVYLTSSMPFFSKIDSTSFFNSMVSVAKVTVTDGVNTEILTLKKDIKRYPPLYYEGTELKGEIGKTYQIIVNYRNKIITGTTTIPPAPKLNSISFNLEHPKDSLGSLRISFTDEGSQHNYYRTFTQRKNQDSKYYPTNINTFDDIYFNGQSFHYDLYQGVKSIDTYDPNGKYYQIGDTVYVKLCSIDKPSFDFWNTIQGKTLNIISFASSPNQLKTNITGGNGIWCGYGATYYTYIIN